MNKSPKYAISIQYHDVLSSVSNIDKTMRMYLDYHKIEYIYGGVTYLLYSRSDMLKAKTFADSNNFPYDTSVLFTSPLTNA